MNRGLHAGLAAPDHEVGLGGIVAGWIDDPRFEAMNGPIKIVPAPTAALGQRYPKITVTKSTAPCTIISMVWTGTEFAAIGATAYNTLNAYVFTTTTDGVTWTAPVTLPTAHWRKLGWNGTNYSIIGVNSALTIAVSSYSSTGGATWDTTTNIQTTGNLDFSDIVWDGTRFVAVNRVNEVFYYSTTGASYSIGAATGGVINGIATDGSGTIVVSNGIVSRGDLGKTTNAATTAIAYKYGVLPFAYTNITYHSGSYYMAGARGYAISADGESVSSHTAYGTYVGTQLDNPAFASTLSLATPTSLAHNGEQLLGVYSMDHYNTVQPGCVSSIALLHRYETVRYNFSGHGDIWGRIISNGTLTMIYGGHWRCQTKAVGLVNVDTSMMQVPQPQEVKLPKLYMRVR